MAKCNLQFLNNKCVNGGKHEADVNIVTSVVTVRSIDEVTKLVPGGLGPVLIRRFNQL